MTICLAIKCKKSEKKTKRPVLLFASDTQESSKYIKRSVAKMREIYGKTPRKHRLKWGVLVGSAGDAMVIDEVLNDIEVLLHNGIKADDRPSEKLKFLRKEIGELAYATYEKYRDRNIGDPYFELLLGAADKFATILYVTSEGKQQLLDQFGIIGSGQVTGGELILSEFLREDMTQEEAANLAALVVTRIGNVDLSVGGEPDIRWCRSRHIWHYEEFKFEGIMEESGKRWEMLQKAWWRMQDDKTTKRKLKRLL